MALHVATALEALRAALAANFATAKTNLSSTLTAPYSWNLVDTDIHLQKGSRSPCAFVVPVPEGRPIVTRSLSTRPARVWDIPVDVRIEFRPVSGNEGDNLNAAWDYAELLDHCLCLEAVYRPTDRSNLGKDWQTIAGLAAAGDRKAANIWAARASLTLHVRAEYATS